MSRFLRWGFVLLFLAQGSAALAQDKPRVIHLFVALCDNKSQGIVPVPPKIGNGDDPANNLYWGCSEGAKAVFSHAAEWQAVPGIKSPAPEILERCVFKHATLDAYLVADAYRGSEIKHAISDFLESAAGKREEKLQVTVNRAPVELNLSGGASLVAYIGHNGLMEFAAPATDATRGASAKPAIVLCCKSETFFREPLARAGAKPVLTTTQLMYPGAFILKAALDGWLKGEAPAALRERAAKAYAENQKISLSAARGVFTEW